MTVLQPLELALFEAAKQLGLLRSEVVFVGGAVRGLLVTDLGAAGVRPTDDVDVIRRSYLTERLSGGRGPPAR